MRILPVGSRPVPYHGCFFVKVKNEIGLGEVSAFIHGKVCGRIFFDLLSYF